MTTATTTETTTVELTDTQLAALRDAAMIAFWSGRKPSNPEVLSQLKQAVKDIDAHLDAIGYVGTNDQFVGHATATASLFDLLGL